MKRIFSTWWFVLVLSFCTNSNAFAGDEVPTGGRCSVEAIADALLMPVRRGLGERGDMFRGIFSPAHKTNAKLKGAEFRDRLLTELRQRLIDEKGPASENAARTDVVAGGSVVEYLRRLASGLSDAGLAAVSALLEKMEFEGTQRGLLTLFFLELENEHPGTWAEIASAVKPFLAVEEKPLFLNPGLREALSKTTEAERRFFEQLKRPGETGTPFRERGVRRSVKFLAALATLALAVAPHWQDGWTHAIDQAWQTFKDSPRPAAVAGKKEEPPPTHEEVQPPIELPGELQGVFPIEKPLAPNSPKKENVEIKPGPKNPPPGPKVVPIRPAPAVRGKFTMAKEIAEPKTKGSWGEVGLGTQTDTTLELLLTDAQRQYSIEILDASGNQKFPYEIKDGVYVLRDLPRNETGVIKVRVEERGRLLFQRWFVVRGGTKLSLDMLPR